MKEAKTCPGRYQSESTWGKAYWDFNPDNWQDWLNSFKSFPIKNYTEHIGHIIDMYSPNDIALDFK